MTAKRSRPASRPPAAPGKAGGLAGREILLGVTGSIAAYKAPEIARLLVKRGARVTCVCTRSALQFVTEASLATVTGRPVYVELFDAGSARIEHVRLADEADLLLLAPATAHTLSRLAAGYADDLLATLYLATRAPVLAAPAMNVNMWRHPATRRAVERLGADGVRFVAPGTGELACGWIGEGRLAEPAEIVDEAEKLLASRPRRASAPRAELSPARGPLFGRTVVVSAGPTREFLDPVRFLSNPSTGRMGYAVAAAAAERGAEVVLVSGPTALAPPPGARIVSVTSVEEMRRAMLAESARAHLVVMAAAVGDYAAAAPSTSKLRRSRGRLVVRLRPTSDILAELARRRGRARSPILVGFAAETGGEVASAERKLREKRVDYMVANDVSEPGSGFGTETNRATLVGRDGRRVAFPLLPKAELASRLLDAIAPGR